MKLIDLHTHSLFSDGVLLPSELARRAQVSGYSVLGITDHADISNLDHIVLRLAKVCEQLSAKGQIKVVAGIELTHVPPDDIADLVKEARALGAQLIIVHGETIAEPVAPGANLAALSCPIDILAHPGQISLTEAKLAAESGGYLEISARGGHCLSNGHVALMAKKAGAKLILGSDAHAPGDLLNLDFAQKVICGAGLTEAEAEAVFNNADELADRIMQD